MADILVYKNNESAGLIRDGDQLGVRPDPSATIGSPLDIFNSWLTSLGNPSLLLDVSLTGAQIYETTDISYNIASHPWDVFGNLDVHFTNGNSLTFCDTPSSSSVQLTSLAGYTNRAPVSVYNYLTFFFYLSGADTCARKLYTNANETIIYVELTRSTSGYEEWICSFAFRITATTFDVHYYNWTFTNFTSSIKVELHTFDPNPVFNTFQPFDTRYSGYYDWSNLKQYRIDGAITESLYPNEFNILTYDMDFNLESINLIDTNTDSTYRLKRNFQETFYVTCQPKTEVWANNKFYQLGTLIIPRTPTNAGYYYEVTTEGTSGSTEPSWEVGEGSTTTDNTVVWTRKDFIVRPQIHGPVTFYPFDGVF